MVKPLIDHWKPFQSNQWRIDRYDLKRCLSITVANDRFYLALKYDSNIITVIINHTYIYIYFKIVYDVS